MEMELLNKILEKLEHLEQKVDHGLNSLRSEMTGEMNSFRGEMNSLDGKMNSLTGEMNSFRGEINVKLAKLQESVERIEIAQQEDVLTILNIMDVKLEDTAKKSDVDNLRQDIEFTVKENSLFKLELDRLKRNAYE